MFIHKTKIVALVAATILALPAFSAELYVNGNSGNNRNDGSKSAPLKNIQKAIDNAANGDTIYVAEGNYFGTLNKGNIIVSKPVKIMGGYSADFSKRDILKYKTLVQPTPESNGTASGQGTIQITATVAGDVVLDGLLIDRGNSIAYNASGDGKPSGVESPMMQPIGGSGIGGADLKTQNVHTTETAEVYIGNPACNITIRNCAFVNAPNYGIMGTSKTDIKIENCIFINCRMAAVQVRGGRADSQKNIRIDFKNNTILFAWARLRDMGDMGYGFRYMNGADSYVEGNIIGLTTFSGLDRAYVETSKAKEAQKITTAKNNLFFLCKQGDLTLPGGGMFMRINVDDFDDVEQFAEVSGNISLKDPKVFKGKLDNAYLNGFLSASYKEKTDFDPNSPANTFRQAMGMNMVGTMQSSVTMFANRYPFEKALVLFGAVKGYGAQLPK
ncbi:MAG: right-handed parallel beta-helix repeat-containing protein [Treponema sp.]|nr:right-handed parallel beta-helix repeat-containing protein [Treponema sp.]